MACRVGYVMYPWPDAFRLRDPLVRIGQQLGQFVRVCLKLCCSQRHELGEKLEDIRGGEASVGTFVMLRKHDHFPYRLRNQSR